MIGKQVRWDGEIASVRLYCTYVDEPRMARCVLPVNHKEGCYIVGKEMPLAIAVTKADKLAKELF